MILELLVTVIWRASGVTGAAALNGWYRGTASRMGGLEARRTLAVYLIFAPGGLLYFAVAMMVSGFAYHGWSLAWTDIPYKDINR